MKGDRVDPKDTVEMTEINLTQVFYRHPGAGEREHGVP